MAAGEAGAEGEQQNATTARSSTDGAAGMGGQAAAVPKDLLVGHRWVGYAVFCVQWAALQHTNTQRQQLDSVRKDLGGARLRWYTAVYPCSGLHVVGCLATHKPSAAAV